MNLPRLPVMLLAVDKVVVNRPNGQVDSNGNDVGTLALVAGITRGTYAAPSATDVAAAGQRSTKLDAVVVFVPGTDIRAGDRITVRGATFDVVGIADARNRVRALIRKITPP